MGQSSLGFNADPDEDEPDELPGANAMPDSSDRRASSSVQSPNFELTAASKLLADAARSAGSTFAAASSNNSGDTSDRAGSYASGPADPPPGSETAQSSQAQPPQSSPAPRQSPPPQSSSNDSYYNSDALAQPAAAGATSSFRQRQPMKQIGQLPDIAPLPSFDEWYANPSQGQLATQLRAQQMQDREQQVAQINQSDPYISGEDGRWKKQAADPYTGAVHEMDILDARAGQMDRGTGNISVQTSQGPQVIGVDPQQQRLAQIVARKAQAQAQGSPVDASIAAARSALSDTQQRLQSYQGIPERMSAQIAKYTQASLDPNNSAAAGQLQRAQQSFANWKQQNPGYTALIARRDALANQLQSQAAAKAQNHAQVAQLLATPRYAQWSGVTPQAPAPGGQDPSAFGESMGFNGSNSLNGSSPESDFSIHDLDSRAGVIAGQTGYPAGLAYASALGEAKQRGARTVDGSGIDDALRGVQSVAQGQLQKLTPPQLRQAFQSGLITWQQAQAAAMAQRAVAAQPATNSPASAGADTAAGASDKAPASSYKDAFPGTIATASNTAASSNAAFGNAPAAGNGLTDGDTIPQTDPLAQSVTALAARAARFRSKIQSAFNTGGADGAKALASYRADLADTEDQLHAASQSMIARVPDAMQQRIVKAVAPDLDWDDVTEQNAQDPMAHFATENIGSALRDQAVAPDLQERIRRLAIYHGVNPELADHAVNQAVGANAVKDLMTVLRGDRIGQASAETLQHMGLLRQSDPTDPSSPLHVTDDALSLLPPGGQKFAQLRPDLAAYTPSPDPASGSALYQNAVGGMQHIAESAEAMLPAPTTTPTPTQKIAASGGGDLRQSAGTSADASGALIPVSGGAPQPNLSALRITNTSAGIQGPIPKLEYLVAGTGGSNSQSDRAAAYTSANTTAAAGTPPDKAGNSIDTQSPPNTSATPKVKPEPWIPLPNGPLHHYAPFSPDEQFNHQLNKSAQRADSATPIMQLFTDTVPSPDGSGGRLVWKTGNPSLTADVWAPNGTGFHEEAHVVNSLVLYREARAEIQKYMNQTYTPAQMSVVRTIAANRQAWAGLSVLLANSLMHSGKSMILPDPTSPVWTLSPKDVYYPKENAITRLKNQIEELNNRYEDAKFTLSHTK